MKSENKAKNKNMQECFDLMSEKLRKYEGLTEMYNILLKEKEALQDKNYMLNKMLDKAHHKIAYFTSRNNQLEKKLKRITTFELLTVICYVIIFVAFILNVNCGY